MKRYIVVFTVDDKDAAFLSILLKFVKSIHIKNAVVDSIESLDPKPIMEVS